MRGVLDRGSMELIRRNQRPRLAVLPDVKERVDGCSIRYVIPLVISEKGPPSHWRFVVVRIACACGSLAVAVVLR